MIIYQLFLGEYSFIVIMTEKEIKTIDKKDKFWSQMSYWVFWFKRFVFYISYFIYTISLTIIIKMYNKVKRPHFDVLICAPELAISRHVEIIARSWLATLSVFLICAPFHHQSNQASISQQKIFIYSPARN